MHGRAAAIAGRIEAELRRLGRWSAAPIEPERLVDMGPFGARTLAAEEWIQHVLLERLRTMIATGAPLPAESQTAVWATRAFDGDPDAAGLLELLRELDALVEDPVLATVHRLIAILRHVPAVRAAHLVQIHAPHTGELTSPAVGLELAGDFPSDAFAAWPKSDPLVIFALGDDLLSRLARLTHPIYTAAGPPPGMTDLEYYK